MTLGDSIHLIKEKAEGIDLNTLYENIINDMEEPTPINFKDLKNRTHLA